ncbi:hypothetical protein QBC37DRAFT_456071 [Rhypophila decipiens]|uniref:Uncharacterized protein n=1 Tax=Rhypophila decipiens TaxID=261697 RepID=A0AAN6XVB0_9PEZI|nr:hypothetical protein QBC37DRAFT_456071 [Rhypophila decipiens]
MRPATAADLEAAGLELWQGLQLLDLTLVGENFLSHLVATSGGKHIHARGPRGLEGSEPPKQILLRQNLPPAPIEDWILLDAANAGATDSHKPCLLPRYQLDFKSEDKLLKVGAGAALEHLLASPDKAWTAEAIQSAGLDEPTAAQFSLYLGIRSFRRYLTHQQEGHSSCSRSSWDDSRHGDESIFLESLFHQNLAQVILDRKLAMPYLSRYGAFEDLHIALASSTEYFGRSDVVAREPGQGQPPINSQQTDMPATGKPFDPIIPCLMVDVSRQDVALFPQGSKCQACQGVRQYGMPKWLKIFMVDLEAGYLYAIRPRSLIDYW